MVRRRYFEHSTPDGVSVVQRVRSSGYLGPGHGWLVGENLAWGSRDRGSPRATVRAWMNSPPHREVLLNPSYRDVGIGVAWGSPISRSWRAATYTADFGVKR